jgi:ATP-dependent Lon protease
MATSLYSAITKKKMAWDIAMTGEITLRGRVLPIGGLKEKALAALRAGIKKVIIPAQNKMDLIEIPKNIREQMEFFPVKNMDQILKIAFGETKKGSKEKKGSKGRGAKGSRGKK